MSAVEREKKKNWQVERFQHISSLYLAKVSPKLNGETQIWKWMNRGGWRGGYVAKGVKNK